MYDLIPRTSYEVADALRKGKQQIFELWVAKARAEVDAALDSPQLTLIDHLPHFIDHLADALDPQVASSQPCGNGVCRVHGHLRASEPSYTLREMLREYRLLREVTFQVLESRRRLQPELRDYLVDAIDQAMEEAAEVFSLDRSRDLRQAKEAAESLAKHQERFVAILSHDLRNPIGTAIMGLELLEDDYKADQGTQEILDLMRRNLKRAEIMLRDLLDVARLNSGHDFVLRRETCFLDDIVQEAIADQDPALGKRFEFVPFAGKKAGYWDKTALRRVIDNLLSNALKYGDRDYPIEIAIRKSESHIELSIHNQGEAISSAVQAKLFEPFGRTGAGETSAEEGWGLGLSVVRAVTRAHGGECSVMSQHGQGTTFSIWLPLSEKI